MRKIADFRAGFFSVFRLKKKKKKKKNEFLKLKIGNKKRVKKIKFHIKVFKKTHLQNFEKFDHVVSQIQKRNSGLFDRFFLFFLYFYMKKPTFGVKKHDFHMKNIKTQGLKIPQNLKKWPNWTDF
jgi:hypothetical protein